MNLTSALDLIARHVAAGLIDSDTAASATAAASADEAFGTPLDDSNRGRLLSLAYGIRTSCPVNIAPSFTVLEA